MTTQWLFYFLLFFKVIEINMNSRLSKVDSTAFQGSQTTLEALDLSNNSLTAFVLIDTLKSFTSLITFSLSGNKIGGSIYVSHIP